MSVSSVVRPRALLRPAAVLAVVALASSGLVLVTGTASAASSSLPSSASTRAGPAMAPPDDYHWTSYPVSFDYRRLSNADPTIACGQSDAGFRARMVADGYDRYQGQVVDGLRGSCMRSKAEQFKRLFPDKVVINRQLMIWNPDLIPGTWPGYYALMNRTVTTVVPSTTTTSLSVASTAAVAPGELALLWAPVNSDLFGAFEYVRIVSVDSPTSVSVQRGQYGFGPTTFATAPFLASILMDPAVLMPVLNLSAMAPVNPANAKRAWEWMADYYAADFAPAPGAPALDGIEFDTFKFKPPTYNQNDGVENLDCDADGVMDYCQQGNGTTAQITSWGVGYQLLLDRLKAAIATYDAPGTRTPKVIIIDQGQYNQAPGFGGEYESFPSWDTYSKSSEDLSRLDVLNHASASGISYAYTKDISPTYPSVSDQNPNGCIVPPAGKCRNGAYRYGIVAASMSDAAFAYNDEAWMDKPLPLDEEATINQTATGLTAGYLGAALAAPVRQFRYSGPNLVPTSDFESGLGTWSYAKTPGVTGSLTLDATTAGQGSKSMRADVDLAMLDPSYGDAKPRIALTGPITANTEYTVSFWAKATGVGTSFRTTRVVLDGSGGLVHQVTLTPQWHQYFISVLASSGMSSGAYLRLLVGADTGSYWFDDVQVHQDTAGVITRQFTNGLLVLNDSDATQTNVALPGGPYHKFLGVQDPVVNDGSSVGAVLPTIASKDGIILLRGATASVTLVSIELTPAAPTLASGTTMLVAATGTYSDGTTADLTSSVTWSTGSARVATVSAGVLTATGVGTTTISATFGDLTGSTTVVVEPATLQGLQVTPPIASMPTGTSSALTATGTYSDGSTQNLSATASWASSDPTAATVDASGVVTAVRAGTTTVTAATGAFSATASVTVTAAALVALQVTPPMASLPRGTTIQLTATGAYTDGSTRDLTDLVTWSANWPNTASVTDPGGLVTAKSAGHSTPVKATYGGFTSQSIISVTAAVLTGLQLSPSSPSVPKGATVQLTATGTYSDGKALDLSASAAWSSSNPARASIDQTGLVSAATPGNTTITAVVGGFTTSTVVTVTAAALAALQVTPPAPSLPKGTTVQLTATGIYTDGTTRDLTALGNWTSSVTSRATVTSPGGLVTAVRIGTAKLTATMGGFTDSVVLTVTAAALESVQVTPTAPSLAMGATLQLTATGFYTDGSTQNLTTSVSWVSSDPTRVTITSPGGLATAVASGPVTITATVGAVSGSTTVMATEAALITIQVTPPITTQPEGTTVQFTASGIYSDDSTQDLTNEVSWISARPTVLTITTPGGLGTVGRPGTTQLSATLGAITGKAILTATPAALVSIDVASPPVPLPMGLTSQLTATGTYTDGTTKKLITASWVSSDRHVATVTSPGGLVTGVTEGTVTVTVTLSGVSGTKVVTVSPAILSSIAVTPTGVSLPKGVAQQLTAMGTYSDGSVLDITAAVSWTSTAIGKVTVSSPGGLATGVGVGSATIRAMLAGVLDSTVVTVTAAALVSVAVTPPGVSLSIGVALQMTATGTYTDDSTHTLTSTATWISSAPSLVTVSSPGGLATAAALGTATIRATSGGISGRVDITAVAAILSSIIVTPAAPSLAKGLTLQMLATGILTDGSPENLTDQVAWTTNWPTVATVTSTGLVTALTTRTTPVKATLGTITGQTTMTVIAAALTGIEVSPPSASLAKGTTAQLAVTGTYTDGTTNAVTATWSTSAGGKAIVSSAGLVTAVGTGSATITARSGGFMATSAITVTPATLESITVTPASPSLPRGATLAMTATGTYTDDTTLDLTSTVTWSSGWLGVLTVTSDGVVTAEAVGSTKVKATLGALVGSTTVTVT